MAKTVYISTDNVNNVICDLSHEERGNFISVLKI